MLKKLFLSLPIIFVFAGNAAAVEKNSTEQLRSFIKNCVEFSESSFDPQMKGSAVKWEFEGKYKVVYTNKKIFSYLAEELYYTGGANGNFKVSVGSLYRGSGKVIRIKDIAPTDRMRKKLLDLVTAGVARYFKCSVNELPKKILGKKVFLPENFYLNDKGVVFVFNEYEIASKGAGAIKILVPYKQYKVKL